MLVYVCFAFTCRLVGVCINSVVIAFDYLYADVYSFVNGLVVGCFRSFRFGCLVFGLLVASVWFLVCVCYLVVCLLLFVGVCVCVLLLGFLLVLLFMVGVYSFGSVAL